MTSFLIAFGFADLTETVDDVVYDTSGSDTHIDTDDNHVPDEIHFSGSLNNYTITHDGNTGYRYVTDLTTGDVNIVSGFEHFYFDDADVILNMGTYLIGTSQNDAGSVGDNYFAAFGNGGTDRIIFSHLSSDVDIELYGDQVRVVGDDFDTWLFSVEKITLDDITFTTSGIVNGTDAADVFTLADGTSYIDGKDGSDTLLLSGTSIHDVAETTGTAYELNTADGVT